MDGNKYCGHTCYGMTTQTMHFELILEHHESNSLNSTGTQKKSTSILNEYFYIMIYSVALQFKVNILKL